MNSKEVLIVGAGEDPYRFIFPAAEKYHCLDIAKVGDHIDIVADAHNLPLEDTSFDTVFASEVLEHLRTPGVFVEEAYRVLRPGGRLILTMPYMYHEHSDPFDFWRPTKSGLESLCANFTEVNIEKHGNRIHVISDLLTTSFAPKAFLFPLRFFNFLLYLLPQSNNSNSTSPSGHFLVATK